MTIEEFDKTMENIPKIQTNNPISSMNSINVDELRKTAEIFKRIPTFDDLQKENNKLLKEKQELIDYLKEKITKCDKDIKIHKKEIAGVVNISENNRHILLIKRFKVEKQIYEEILSKIEKR